MKRSIVAIDPGGRLHPSGIICLVVDDHQGTTAWPGSANIRWPVYVDSGNGLPAAATPAEPPRSYSVTHIERRGLEGYPELVHYVRGLALHPGLVIDGERPETVVDSTGIGAPIVDMMRAAGIQRIRRLVVTGGAGAARVKGEYHVGRTALMEKLDAVAHPIHIPPALPDGPGTADEKDSRHAPAGTVALMAELEAIKAVTTAAGKERYESSGVDDDGQLHHGDLVSALAMAVVWGAQMRLTGSTYTIDSYAKVRR